MLRGLLKGLAPAPRSGDAPAEPGPGERLLAVAIGVLAGLLGLAHALPAFVPRGWAWGADAFAFLPAPAGWFATGAAVAAALGALRWRPPAEPSPGRERGAAMRAAVVGGALALAALAFWWLRARHVLLGDGIPLTTLLPDARGLHPREPLAHLVQHALYDLLAPVFAGPGVPRAQVVWACVAVGSVLAGVLFVPVAAALGRELVRSFPARERGDETHLAAVLAAAVFAQGYAQVFFGYVENYALPVVAGALFLLAGLRFLRGRGSLLLPLGAVALAVALDFTAVVLGPATLVLVAAGLLDPARRRAVARDTLLAVGASAALLAWLAWGPARYPVLANLFAMLGTGRGEPGYLLSADHLRDFLNEHLLLGPFGMVLLLPAALAFAARRRRPDAAAAFALAAGLAAGLACWIATDLPLGYARDWDLFAPLGVVLTGAALALVLAQLGGRLARWRVAAAIAIVSLFHTAPWVVLNASEGRSLARFETLPLDGGRRETTLAWWHAQRGDFAAARRQLDRALAIEPENSRALDLYGRVAFAQGDAKLALRAYLIAVTLRPDKPDYREQLARAVLAVGGPEPALRELDAQLAGHENNGGLWLERAMLLHAAGRADEAALAKARALELWPWLAGMPDRLPPPAAIRP